MQFIESVCSKAKCYFMGRLIFSHWGTEKRCSLNLTDWFILGPRAVQSSVSTVFDAVCLATLTRHEALEKRGLGVSNKNNTAFSFGWCTTLHLRGKKRVYWKALRSCLVSADEMLAVFFLTAKGAGEMLNSGRIILPLTNVSNWQTSAKKMEIAGYWKYKTHLETKPLSS